VAARRYKNARPPEKEGVTERERGERAEERPQDQRERSKGARTAPLVGTSMRSLG